MVTNNNHKTPADLTSDDNVLELVRKAMSGRLVIGSYRPLRQTRNHFGHQPQPETATHNTDHTHPHPRGYSHPHPSDYSYTHLGGPVQSVLLTHSSNASSSDADKSASSEYAQFPDQARVKNVVTQEGSFDGEACKSNVVVEGRSYDIAARDDGIGRACDTGTGSLPEDKARMWPLEEKKVWLFDEEHRALCNKWADSRLRGHSSEQENVTVPQDQSATEHDIVASVPDDHPSGVNRCEDAVIIQNQTSDPASTEGQSLDLSCSMGQNSDMSGWCAPQHVHASEVGAVDGLEPNPPTDGNLIHLLNAIEDFDR